MVVFLKEDAVTGYGKTKDPENYGGKDIGLFGKAEPFYVGHGCLGNAEQIEETNDGHKSGILEQGKKIVGQTWDN